MKRLILIVFTICISYVTWPGSEVSAEIYKCKNKNSTTRFSDTPCGDNAEVVNLKEGNTVTRGGKGAFVCPSGIIAIISNILYPTLTSEKEAIRQAESALDSKRYRKAIKRVDPSGEYPDKVSSVRAEAHSAKIDPGFSSGMIVNVRICK